MGKFQFPDIGKIIGGDAEQHAAEFRDQSMEILRTELGAAFKAAPHLEESARKATFAYARYKFLELQGKKIPEDAYDQVTAQLANVKVDGMVIAADAFKRTVMSVIAAGFGAIGGFFGNAMGALAKAGGDMVK